MIYSCLTFDQLDAYSTKKMSDVERSQLYQHISTCELCACAVNGFTAVPFTSHDLVAIQREIDVRSGSTSVNSLILARTGIVIASVLSVVGLNILCMTRSVEKPAFTNSISKNSKINWIHHETQKASTEEISAAATTFKKVVNAARYNTFERNISAAERLELIKPAGICATAEGLNEAEIIDYPVKDVIYIYDLKVSSYNDLYFSPEVMEMNLFKTHTPVYKENKKSPDDEGSFERRIIPADRILKHGLEAFNKQHFVTAILDFQILLKKNNEDVNAQFYSALAYYNINKPNKALEFLSMVMQNSNTSFYAEAQWFSALVYLKSGNNEQAKIILMTIVTEKGFYSKRAAEKLKMLN